MIHSIDSYLQHSIAYYLQAFLSNHYIINEEVLGEFDKDTRQSFVKTFCTDIPDHSPGVHIPVKFTYNATKPNPYATILIQQESGKELVKEDQSLGYNDGQSKPKGNMQTTEASPLEYDPKAHEAFLMVKHIPTSVENINSISHSKIKLKGHRIYLLNPISKKLAMMNNTPEATETVHYRYTAGSHILNNNKRTYDIMGYDATENYTIDIISQNINTIRCLGALMKVIFISMRLKSQRENTEYYIPKISETNVDLIHTLNDDKQSTAYNQLFYKRFTLNYIVTQTVTAKLGLFIKHIISMPKLTHSDNQNQHSD